MDKEITNQVPAEQIPAPETQVTQPNDQGTPNDGNPSQEPVGGLVRLPDGRSVPIAMAEQVFASLQADHTRKSQKAAELERQLQQLQTPKEPEVFEPQTWDDVIKKAKAEALSELQAQSQAERQREEQLNAEIDAIKQIDPNLNEESVYDFANKQNEMFGITFPNFGSAYKAYKDRQEYEAITERRLMEQIKAKQADPIAATPKSTPSAATPPSNLDRRAKGLWLLNQMKSNN